MEICEVVNNESQELTKEEIKQYFSEADKILFPSKRMKALKPVTMFVAKRYSKVVEVLCDFLSEIKKGEVSLAEVAFIESIISCRAKKRTDVSYETLKCAPPIQIPLYVDPVREEKDEDCYIRDISDIAYVSMKELIMIVDNNNATVFVPVDWFDGNLLECIEQYKKDIAYHLENQVDRDISSVKSQIETLGLKLKSLEEKKAEFEKIKKK